MTQNKESSALFPFGTQVEKKTLTKKPLKSGWVYMDDNIKEKLPLGWDQDNVSTQIGIMWALNYDVLSKKMKIIDLTQSTFVQRLNLLRLMHEMLGLKFEQDIPPSTESNG